MVALTICWKAIGVIALMAGIVCVIGLLMKVVFDLIESDSTTLKVLGWIILMGTTFVTLLGVYFVFAKDLCG